MTSPRQLMSRSSWPLTGVALLLADNSIPGRIAELMNREAHNVRISNMNCQLNKHLPTTATLPSCQGLYELASFWILLLGPSSPDPPFSEPHRPFPRREGFRQTSETFSPAAYRSPPRSKRKAPLEPPFDPAWRHLLFLWDTSSASTVRQATKNGW